ncbi:P-loop NTPase [Glacieibacterium sp.]|uniref:Mrp/NBP35 family ATP-binding protein n=1 Tax=Glacieibacterium sp. TaxID=2860237 RepID=UPI003B00B925
MPDREEVGAALAGIADPSGGGSVLETGRAGGLRLKDGVAGLVLSVDGLTQDVAERLRAEVEVALRRVPRVTGVRIILTADKAAAPAGVAVAQDSAVPGIRRLVAVASGKGGVGKSTVAANLAVALAKRGLAVGLLDADIYGPSVPTLLGIPGRAQLEDGKLLPMTAHGIKALSIGMMMATDKAVIWRGPMAASAMMQMIEQANWGVLDILVIDLPPGTGDIQLTMAQKLKPSGAVVVSTPQDLALIDARRAIAMFNEVKVPVLGMVENMSTFVCPHCGERSDIFGHGGAAALGEGLGVPFLGAVPLTMTLRLASDAGQPGSAPEFAGIAERVAIGLGL